MELKSDSVLGNLVSEKIIKEELAFVKQECERDSTEPGAKKLSVGDYAVRLRLSFHCCTPSEKYTCIHCLSIETTSEKM